MDEGAALGTSAYGGGHQVEQYRPHCADFCQHVTVEPLEITDLIAQPPVHQAAAAVRGPKVTLSVATVAAIALLDALFSGYRAAQGRTGRLSSLRRDALAHLRGACVWALLIMVPLGAGHVWLEPHSVKRAFDAMVLTPYALVTLTAILAWCVLSWRVRYLAMALVLAP